MPTWSIIVVLLAAIDGALLLGIRRIRAKIAALDEDEKHRGPYGR